MHELLNVFRLLEAKHVFGFLYDFFFVPSISFQYLESIVIRLKIFHQGWVESIMFQSEHLNKFNLAVMSSVSRIESRKDLKLKS